MSTVVREATKQSAACWRRGVLEEIAAPCYPTSMLKLTVWKALGGALVFLLFSGICLLTSSCAGKFPSYGVVIWSDNEQSVKTGSIVAITARSSFKKTLQIRLLDDKGDAAGKPISSPVWRILELNSFGAAQDWVKKNNELLLMFGRATKQALPVREDPVIQDSNIIYRLRDQETVKIVSKQDKESDEGGLKGFWYEILTDTGTQGWVFSAQLELYQPGVSKPATELTEDAQIQALSTGNWRPEDFGYMLEKKRYDFDLFGPDRGFRIDTAKKTIHISVAKDILDFYYVSLDKLQTGTYLARGPGVQITFRDDTSIVVDYQKGDSAASRVFVNMPQNIQQAWDEEVARRAGMLAGIAGGKGNIRSDNYGSITISSDGSFVWSNLSALQPSIVPPAATGTGTISFNIYPEGDLNNQYRGVATFNFALPSGSEAINFLYQLKPDGVQFEFLPRSYIKGNLAKRADSSPTVLFFAY